MDDLLAFFQGQIQAQIGTFLSLKSPLVLMKNSPNPQIASQANILYSTQIGLETQLSKITSEIDQIKAGQITALTLVDLTVFYYQMLQQINDVHDIQNRYPMTIFDTIPTWLWIGLFGALIILNLNRR